MGQRRGQREEAAWGDDVPPLGDGHLSPGDVPHCCIELKQTPDGCPLQQQHQKGSHMRHPTQNERSAGWLVLIPLEAKSWHGSEAEDMKGTVHWAVMAQPFDPAGQFSPADLGTIPRFAQRSPAAAHELRALALSMQEHSMETCCHRPTTCTEELVGAQSGVVNEEQTP